MARHSFIQMSKLPNVKGRISYITSKAKQENLYATYRTADNTFWNNLARESQQEFKRSGTPGKCIEARELIIALPELYTKFDPDKVLKDFTDLFRRRYGVECVSALHHNKRKTNYHIHLIFSERKLLPETDIKIATRSVFFNETGQRVRTKKSSGRTDRYEKAVGLSKRVRFTKATFLPPKTSASKVNPFLKKSSRFTPPISTAISQTPNSSSRSLTKTAYICPLRKSARTIRERKKSRPTMPQGRNGIEQRIWHLSQAFRKKRYWRSSRRRSMKKSASLSVTAVGFPTCSAVL